MSSPDRPSKNSMDLSPAHAGRQSLLHLGFGVVVGLALWWLGWTAISRHWPAIRPIFIPASVVLAGGLYLLHNELHWARPARKLQSMLADLRRGAVPIDELAHLHGGLRPLVPELQQVFRDLKNHRNEMAQLNGEITRRIEGRTSALERQIGSLRQQATRDGLTGLYNRRMFDALLPRMIERCAGEKLDLSLLMIDVDNFKHLNDTLGHAAGDELLRDIAQLIRSGIREPDAAFRLGGDEYVVILPNLGPAIAAEVSQRLIQLVDALAKPINITIHPRLSIGAASLSQLNEKNAMELVHLADKRLYEMKAEHNRPARKMPLRATA